MKEQKGVLVCAPNRKVEHSMLNRTDICREEVGKRRMAHSDGSEPKRDRGGAALAWYLQVCGNAAG